MTRTQVIAIIALSAAASISFTADAFVPSAKSFGYRQPLRVLTATDLDDIVTTASVTDIDHTHSSASQTEKNMDVDIDTSAAAPQMSFEADKKPIVHAAKKINPKKKKTTTAAHTDGIFSPAVKIAKVLLGDERLNKIRGKAISLHSDTIKSFVDASTDTAAGIAALRSLFTIADKNDDGRLDSQELTYALHGIGFTWLKTKQVEGILKRADSDGDGKIALDEFLAEAPKTLRTNLVKLAKKNGGELGFLV